MIKNIWSIIKIYCGNHGDDKSIEMVPHTGNEHMSMFYACPKYYNDNRNENELACVNRLNLVEYEDFVMHISNILEKDVASVTNLTGYHYKNKKGTEFHIFQHDSKGIKATVLNKKAVK